MVRSESGKLFWIRRPRYANVVLIFYCLKICYPPLAWDCTVLHNDICSVPGSLGEIQAGVLSQQMLLHIFQTKH